MRLGHGMERIEVLQPFCVSVIFTDGQEAAGGLLLYNSAALHLFKKMEAEECGYLLTFMQ